MAPMCGGCGARYGDAAWHALPVSERIEASAVRRIVSPWPEGSAVEVRTCSACGRGIARRA